MTNLENIVQQLYISYYNRPAEPAGLSYWATTLQANGGNLSSIIKAFVNTPESNAIYGANATAEARVNAVYQNIFGRAPEPAGLNYWADLINNKGLDMGEAVMFILQGSQGSDASIVNQKLSIASFYTEQMAANKLSQNDAYTSALYDLKNVSPTSSLPSYMTPVTAAPLSSATSTTSTTTQGGATAGGGAAAFTALLDGNSAVSFGGSATGNITVTTDGTSLTFVRGGNTATNKIPIASIAAAGIPTTPTMEMAAATALTAGVGAKFSQAAITLTDTSVTLANLKTIEAATTGLVTATTVTSTSGSAADAKLLLVTNEGTTGDKIDMKSDVAVTLSDTGSVTLADLKAIEAATTGLVNATTVTSTSGSIADAVLMLSTNEGTTGDKIDMKADVAVTLSDVGSQADTDTILSKTTGVVTTKQLTAATYTNFATGDKIDTGLTFAANTSQTLVNDTDLHWNFASGTLTIETLADSSANVVLVLTGIASVTETGGVFTLSTV